MTKLFETSWFDNFKVYERVFDPETGITQVNKIDGKSEYFVEDPKGLYSDFLDLLSYVLSTLLAECYLSSS